MGYVRREMQDEGDVLGLGGCTIQYTITYTRQPKIPGEWQNRNGDGCPDVPEQIDVDSLQVDGLYPAAGEALTRPATEEDIQAASDLVNRLTDWEKFEEEMYGHEDDDD